MRPIIKIVLILLCALGAGWYVHARRAPAADVAPATRVTVAPPLLPVAPPPKE